MIRGPEHGTAVASGACLLDTHLHAPPADGVGLYAKLPVKWVLLHLNHNETQLVNCIAMW